MPIWTILRDPYYRSCIATRHGWDDPIPESGVSYEIIICMKRLLQRRRCYTASLVNQILLETGCYLLLQEENTCLSLTPLPLYFVLDEI